MESKDWWYLNIPYWTEHKIYNTMARNSLKYNRIVNCIGKRVAHGKYQEGRFYALVLLSKLLKDRQA